MKPKLIVVLGPTASGKSELGVKLARKFNGEIISADSRQIYKDLDIGSGKVLKDKSFGVDSGYSHQGIPHHMIDVANPKEQFSVLNYRKQASTAISSTIRNKHIPIAVGGTGQYIKALVDNFAPPEVPPNEKLRKELEELSTEDLYKKLKNLDPRRAKNIDPHNPRRLVRAIEIAEEIGQVPEQKIGFPRDYSNSPFEILQIGLKIEDSEIKNRIKNRTKERLQNGWVGEVWGLIQNGTGWSRINEFGLGYKCIGDSLKKELDEAYLEECIVNTEWQYAKRQRTWFKRDKRIEWFDHDAETSIINRVSKFINS